jgi:hypothetical protein
MIATCSFLHPECALRALLEFLSDGELHELFVFLVGLAVCGLVVLAGLPSVVLDPAVEAVVLPANVAREVRHSPLLKEEHVVALDVRAP